MQIVILTYESPQANTITHRLLTEYAHHVVGIVCSDTIIAGKTTWQSLRFLFSETGWGFVLPKGMEILLGRFAHLFVRYTGKKTSVPSLLDMGHEYHVPIIKAKNVNKGKPFNTIKAWKPDLVISIYFNQLIRKKIINLPAQGVINIHPALLPRNRGLFPYFWVLANGDAETGVTIHWVDAKFDTGHILVQEQFPVDHDDSVISLARKSADIGAELLLKAVKLIESGNPPRMPQDSKQATYFSWPTPIDVHRFRKHGKRYGSILEIWHDLLVHC